MTRQDVFFIDKATGTFADELVAAGWVRLLHAYFAAVELVPQIAQEDCGGYYKITCNPPLNHDDLTTFSDFISPAPFLQTGKNAKKIPADLPHTPTVWVGYDEEKQQRADYFEWFKKLPKEAKRALFAEGRDVPELESAPPTPHRDWDVFRAINPSALTNYNSLLSQWYVAREQSGLVLQLLCDLFRQSPNDVVGVRKQWVVLAKQFGWKLKDASASQLYNPSQGKGVNKIMPNGAGAGNMKEFWLLAYLKAVGFYEMALTRTMAGGGDRKTYVLAPGRVETQPHRVIMDKFRKNMTGGLTAIKADIFVVINYLKALLDYQETETVQHSAARFFTQLGVRPRDVVRGFHVAFYKDMGNAVALMNLAFLNLPGWVEVKTQTDISTFKAILEEHHEIARLLREDRGEEITLLQSYRDFIVADHLAPFFEFTNGYSSHIISQREKRGGYAPAFTIHNLRRLIMSSEPNYSEILDSPGFQNVAYAIRQSTVTAQYRKKEGDRRYTVRYGLGQDLVRKSQYKKEFLSELGEFMFKFNAENAQVMENRSGPYRRSLNRQDVADVVALTDKFGSDLVCKLLVAFGYARTGPIKSDDGEGGDEG